jgi:hypothetical protein
VRRRPRSVASGGATGVLAGIVLGALLLAGMAACGARAATRGGVSPDDAIVHVQCNVPEAELWVDERYIGPVGALKGGVALPPGAYRIELRHPQHHAFYGEIEVRARERRTLEIALAEQLP